MKDPRLGAGLRVGDRRIQTFSRFIVRGLRDVLPGAEIAVFSKNDTSYPDPESDPADKFTPMGWWSPKLRTTEFAWKLFRSAAWEHPDFIVTTHVNFAPVAHWLQKTVSHSVPGCRPRRRGMGIGNQRVRNALRAADRLIAVSEFTRRRMASTLNLDPNRIALLPDTFDPEEFYPVENRTISEALWLDHEPACYPDHRSTRQRRTLQRVRSTAARAAVGAGTFLKCSIHPRGRGPDRPRVEALIRELNVSASVTLAGYVADYELRGHYNLAMFSRCRARRRVWDVFLEALGCGKPVLAGNKDGSADAVLNGALGVLIDPDDVARDCPML